MSEVQQLQKELDEVRRSSALREKELTNVVEQARSIFELNLAHKTEELEKQHQAQIAEKEAEIAQGKNLLKAKDSVITELTEKLRHADDAKQEALRAQRRAQMEQEEYAKGDASRLRAALENQRYTLEKQLVANAATENKASELSNKLGKTQESLLAEQRRRLEDLEATGRNEVIVKTEDFTRALLQEQHVSRLEAIRERAHARMQVLEYFMLNLVPQLHVLKCDIELDDIPPTREKLPSMATIDKRCAELCHKIVDAVREKVNKYKQLANELEEHDRQQTLELEAIQLRALQLTEYGAVSQEKMTEKMQELASRLARSEALSHRLASRLEGKRMCAITDSNCGSASSQPPTAFIHPMQHQLLQQQQQQHNQQQHDQPPASSRASDAEEMPLEDEIAALREKVAELEKREATGATAAQYENLRYRLLESSNTLTAVRGQLANVERENAKMKQQLIDGDFEQRRLKGVIKIRDERIKQYEDAEVLRAEARARRESCIMTLDGTSEGVAELKATVLMLQQSNSDLKTLLKRAHKSAVMYAMEHDWKLPRDLQHEVDAENNKEVSRENSRERDGVSLPPPSPEDRIQELELLLYNARKERDMWRRKADGALAEASHAEEQRLSSVQRYLDLIGRKEQDYARQLVDGSVSKVPSQIPSPPRNGPPSGGSTPGRHQHSNHQQSSVSDSIKPGHDESSRSGNNNNITEQEMARIDQCIREEGAQKVEGWIRERTLELKAQEAELLQLERNLALRELAVKRKEEMLHHERTTALLKRGGPSAFVQPHQTSATDTSHNTSQHTTGYEGRACTVPGMNNSNINNTSTSSHQQTPSLPPIANGVAPAVPSRRLVPVSQRVPVQQGSNDGQLPDHPQRYGMRKGKE